MKKRFAIFDLDGTLLDTLADLRDSMNHVLKENGFPERTTDEIRRFVGNGIRKLVERAVPKEFSMDTLLIDKLYKEMGSYYKDHCMIKTGLYSGTVEMLKTVKENGYLCAIVSNKIDTAVKELDEKYFGEMMETAIGERPGIKPKPASDMLFAAMEEIGAKKDNSIYIGDSEVDIETVKNAGLSCISVLWGFRDKEFLAENGGEVFVKNMEELTEFLLKWKK